MAIMPEGFQSHMHELGRVFSPMRLFQEAQRYCRGALINGQKIDPETARKLGITDVIFFGNNLVRPDQLTLRPADYQAIGDFVMPGRSALLDFLDIRGKGVSITTAGKDIVSQISFGKNAKRQDRVYIISIENIEAAGYSVYFAPTKTNGLHVRLVYNPHTSLEYPVMTTLPEIPLEAREALIAAFEKTVITGESEDSGGE